MNPAVLPPIDVARTIPILANPRAGTGQSQKVVRELVRSLHQLGMEPILCWKREELTALAQSSQRDRIRCVVSAGGDGTLLEVLNRAPGLPVTILPLGNENLVARYYKLQRSGSMIADVVLRGKLQNADLAQVNGKLFSIMVGVGFDADVVHRVHRRRKGHINKLSWLTPILQSLTHFDYPLVDVEDLDTGERLQGSMLFVFNLPQYAMNLPIARQCVPNDGKLDLCVFQKPGLVNLARYASSVVLGRHDGLPDFQRRLVRHVRLTCARRIAMQTDGDPAGFLPATVEVVPGGMTLVVPGETVMRS